MRRSVPRTTSDSCGAEPGQHFWNVSCYEDDPWAPVNYHTIRGEIDVKLVQQTAEVLAGLDMCELIGRALVVYDYDGQGSACGFLIPETTVADGLVQPAGYSGSALVFH